MNLYRLTFSQTCWPNWVHGWAGKSRTSKCERNFPAKDDKEATDVAKGKFAEAREGSGFVGDPKLFEVVGRRKLRPIPFDG